MLGKEDKVLLVGGGLANGIIAKLLRDRRPDVDFLVIEQGETLGGEHTWSFHETDLAGLGAGAALVRELATASWTGYDVRFPGFVRTVSSPYHAIRSRDFHARLMSHLGDRTLLGRRVRSVEPRRVVLDDGSVLEGSLVIDGRGFASEGGEGRSKMPCAFQKFLGAFVRTRQPHGIVRPILMDATVDQIDGFRFVYTLPWSEHELLVEDTRYSDTSAIDEDAMRLGVMTHLAAHGLAGGVDVLGYERSALPIPFHGSLQPVVRAGVLASGVAAGLFHPTTGYSLPDAVRFAERLVSLPSLRNDEAVPAMNDYARGRWRDGEFFRRLNNMLFRAAEPTRRRRVMEQFYRRDDDLIARFYRADLSALDCVRILSGRPPVPPLRGLRAFFERVAVG